MKTREEVERIRALVAERLAPLAAKVCAIVNHDNVSILPDVLDVYTEMVKDLTDRFYSGVTRYTTSSFLRRRLGDALARRDGAPHIYESAAKARQHLRELGQR